MPLTAADDRFHPPTTAEPTWAETAWFAARIPERELVVWFYPLYRPQLGVMSCAVTVFAPGHRELWELPYHRPYWHQPIPEGLAGPCDVALPNGLTYETLEPLRRYRLRYADGEAFTADLEFTALHEAHPLGVEDGRGHLDQLGRVTGHVVLHGERLEADGIEMRDRTWSPRREARERTRLGYSYGARIDGPAFHCSTKLTGGDEPVFLTGFVLDEDGGKTDLVHATREVVRDARGRPETIRLALSTADGAVREVTGEVRGQTAIVTSPYTMFVSLVRWTLPDGSLVDGEDQDTWSPSRLRTFLREGGFAPATRPRGPATERTTR